MTSFYKIENGKAQVGQGTVVPDGFTAYKEAPQELIAALALEKQEQDLNVQIQEAKNYLKETSWIWEKYSRNVIVLGDLTNEAFKLKYTDIIVKQEEARALINSLWLQVGIV